MQYYTRLAFPSGANVNETVMFSCRFLGFSLNSNTSKNQILLGFFIREVWTSFIVHTSETAVWRLRVIINDNCIFFYRKPTPMQIRVNLNWIWRRKKTKQKNPTTHRPASKGHPCCQNNRRFSAAAAFWAPAAGFRSFAHGGRSLLIFPRCCFGQIWQLDSCETIKNSLKPK